MKKTELILIYTLYPNKKVATAVAKALLEKKLIVCANIIPGVESHYVWNGKISNAKEIIVYYKTSSANKEKAKKEILRNHPYDVPLVAEIPLAHVNGSYLAYLHANIGRQSSR